MKLITKEIRKIIFIIFCLFNLILVTEVKNNKEFNLQSNEIKFKAFCSKGYDLTQVPYIDFDSSNAYSPSTKQIFKVNSYSINPQPESFSQTTNIKNPNFIGSYNDSFGFKLTTLVDHTNTPSALKEALNKSIKNYEPNTIDKAEIKRVRITKERFFLNTNEIEFTVDLITFFKNLIKNKLNDELYNDFIEEYGTHFILEMDVGGLVEEEKLKKKHKTKNKEIIDDKSKENKKKSLEKAKSNQNQSKSDSEDKSKSESSETKSEIETQTESESSETKFESESETNKRKTKRNKKKSKTEEKKIENKKNNIKKEKSKYEDFRTQKKKFGIITDNNTPYTINNYEVKDPTINELKIKPIYLLARFLPEKEFPKKFLIEKKLKIAYNNYFTIFYNKYKTGDLTPFFFKSSYEIKSKMKSNKLSDKSLVEACKESLKQVNENPKEKDEKKKSDFVIKPIIIQEYFSKKTIFKVNKEFTLEDERIAGFVFYQPKNSLLELFRKINFTDKIVCSENQFFLKYKKGIKTKKDNSNIKNICIDQSARNRNPANETRYITDIVAYSFDNKKKVEDFKKIQEDDYINNKPVQKQYEIVDVGKPIITRNNYKVYLYAEYSKDINKPELKHQTKSKSKKSK